MKRAIIMGASSGMGWEVARILAEKGWTLGIAARREENLKALQTLCIGSAEGVSHNSSEKHSDDSIKGKDACASQKIEYQVIDIEQDNAPELLLALIEKIGGMDLYFHGSGVGWHNEELDPSVELKTCAVNTVGFTRMVTAAWNWFKENGGGHIAVISSIAGTKGLGPAPSYSATKSFDNTYIQALAQLSRKSDAGIRFTDIRPGFVDTPLLDTAKHHYPMLMNPQKVARKIVSALERKKRVAIIDWRYRILVFFWRLIPNFLWEHIKL